MKPAFLLKLVAVILLCACSLRAQQQAAIDDYHGTKVRDEYRWLENGTNSAVRAWSAEQNKRARTFLDGLPMRAEIENRLTRLLTNSSSDYFSLSYRPGILFMMRFDPAQQQPALIADNVILDPNRLDKNGGTS